MAAKTYLEVNTSDGRFQKRTASALSLGVANAGDLVALGDAGVLDLSLLPFPAGMTNPMTANGDLIVGAGGVGEASVNVALTSLGVGATSSTNYYPTTTPDLAIDGNSSTYWLAYNGVANQWIALDLGTAKLIGAVQMLQAQPSSNGHADSFRVQSSADGVFWNTIATITTADTDTGSVPITPTSSRYWRFYAVSGGPWGWTVYAVALFTVAAGAPERLPIGADDQVLTVVAGEVAWADSAAGGSGGGPITLTRATPVNVRARKTASQPLTAAASNPITFDVEDRDTTNTFSLATSRWTPGAGLVHIIARISYTTSSSSGHFQSILKNGVALDGVTYRLADTGNPVLIEMTASDLALAGDYYSIEGGLWNGGTCNAATFEGYVIPDAIVSASGGYALTVRATGGDPTITNVTEMRVPNGSIIDLGDGAIELAYGIGAGSSAGSFYDVDVPSLAPSSYDDEFDTATLDPKWTQYHWAAIADSNIDTARPGSYWLRGSSVSYQPAYLLQPIPSGDFTIWTRVRLQTWTQYGLIGLALSAGPTSAQSYIVALHHPSGSAGQLFGCFLFNGDGSYVATPVAVAITTHEVVLRLRRSGSAYTAAVSIDGRTWFETAITPPASLTHFGLAAGNGEGEMSSDFFRYANSATAEVGGLRAFGGASASGLTNPMTTSGDLIVGSAGTTVNAATVALGASASASSSYSGYAPDAVIDLSDSVRWVAGATVGSGEWVKVDLGSAQTIVQYRILEDSAGNAHSWVLQWSNNDSTWTTVLTESNSASPHETGVVTLLTAANARYWRMLGLTGTYGWNVYAIELYSGVPAGTPARLPLGANTQVLTVVAGEVGWAAAASGSGGGLSNPMTAAGDLIVGAAPALTNEATPALGAVATSHSQYQSYAPSYIIDGDDATMGHTQNPATNKWYVVDLAIAKAISVFRVLQDNVGGTYTYTLQSSPDNATWTDQAIVAPATANNGGRHDTGQTTLAAVISARYWRIFGTALGGNGWGVFTFQLFSGQPAGTPSALQIGADDTILKVVSGVPTWTQGGDGVGGLLYLWANYH